MKAYMSLTCKVGTYNKVLEKFSKKWFTPIWMVCCKDNLITKTMMFVVVKNGATFVEDPFVSCF